MLDSLLARKVSPPPMTRVSTSSSSSSSSSSSYTENGVSLMPLTVHEDDRRIARAPERSLRQRSTVTATPYHQSSAALGGPRDEDESPSSSEDESKGGGNGGSSLMGRIFMGPHIFSAAEFCPPPRRKESSGDQKDIQINIDKGNPSFSRDNLYRRSSSQSSPVVSAHGSSFSDVDLESGEQNCSLNEVAPLVPPSPTKGRKSPNSPQKKYAFVLRSRENIIIHLLLEAKMLQTDFLFLLFATFWQFFHSSVTNVAYWQHAQLNVANRVPLRDIAFDVLPTLDGDLWIVSEHILLAILALSISCIVSILIVKWNAPHGRPMYCLQIVRRMGLTWIVCQTLRMISFLVTTLPGASRQCRYAVPDGLTSAEMLNGPAPNEGNPTGWAPPADLNDVLFRVDASNGCGDLMFSSHTIYTMSLVCIIFKYFNFKWLKLIMALGQIAMVPFILAARKHYTVDIFTALYVTPLVFEVLWARFPDRDTSVALAKHYGIRFFLAQEGNDSFSYVVSVWGREFYVDSDHLPVDITRGYLPTGKGGEITRSTASIV